MHIKNRKLCFSFLMSTFKNDIAVMILFQNLLSRKIFLIIPAAIIAFGAVQAQNPATLKNDIKDKKMPKHGIAYRIEESELRSDSSVIQKNIIEFSNHNDTTTTTAFVKKRLFFRNIEVFNPKGYKIYEKKAYHFSDGGKSQTEYSYLYRDTILTQIKKVNSRGSSLINDIVNYDIEYDSLGNVIFMRCRDADGDLYNYETCEYDFQQGLITYRRFNQSGKLFKEYTLYTNDLRNEQGDIILHQETANTFLVTDYKYDQVGNWISKKTYRTFRSATDNQLYRKFIDWKQRIIYYKK